MIVGPRIVEKRGKPHRTQNAPQNQSQAKGLGNQGWPLLSFPNGNTFPAFIFHTRGPGLKAVSLSPTWKVGTAPSGMFPGSMQVFSN